LEMDKIKQTRIAATTAGHWKTFTSYTATGQIPRNATRLVH
jgi:hypothetical protein